MTDVTPSKLDPSKSAIELADELLSRFPHVSRGELLRKMVARAFFQFRHGNKREERDGAEFLNDIQVEASRLSPKLPLPPPPNPQPEPESRGSKRKASRE